MRQAGEPLSLSGLYMSRRSLVGRCDDLECDPFLRSAPDVAKGPLDYGARAALQRVLLLMVCNKDVLKQPAFCPVVSSKDTS